MNMRSNLSTAKQASVKHFVLADEAQNDAVAPATADSASRCAQCALHKVCLTQSVSSGSQSALHRILQHQRPLQKSQHFYRQGDPLQSMYILRSGAVKTYTLNSEGEERITGFVLPGEILGIDGLLGDQHRYCAQALDNTAYCEIPYQQLSQNFQDHPDIQQAIMNVLCREIYQRQQPLLAAQKSPAEEKLATFLSLLTARFQQRGLSSTEFYLPMSRRDIAAYLGMAEETMSRVFSRFQARKLLTVTGRKLSIDDVSSLQSLAITTN